MCTLKNNSEFLFIFEAVNTNPNGDPDQENKPRMDYETNTVLVSDARRKRDCRDYLKEKNHKIFVDTLTDKKVPMPKMFDTIIEEYLIDERKFDRILKKCTELQIIWEDYKKIIGINKNLEAYEEIKKQRKTSGGVKIQHPHNIHNLVYRNYKRCQLILDCLVVLWLLMI